MSIGIPAIALGRNKESVIITKCYSMFLHLNQNSAAQVDDFGGWTPKPSEALLPNPVIVVEVPAASACLVTCVI